MHYEKFADGTVKCIEDEIPFDFPEGWAWCRFFTISIDISAGGDKSEAFSKTKTDKCNISIFFNGIDANELYG